MGRKEKQDKSNKKTRKINALDIITLVVIIVLIAIYAPRAYELYAERKAKLEEANKEPVIVYPLEVEITDKDTEFFTQFFKDYAVGITSGVDFSDDVTEKEMVEFARAILSEKYSSSGVISQTSMDNTLKKYFDVSDVNYKNLGYKSLAVFKDYKTSDVYNITKLMQAEKDGDIYLAYVDVIDKEKTKGKTYTEDDIKEKYLFTFKKVEEKDETGNVTDTRYIIQKTESANISQTEENNEEVAN